MLQSIFIQNYALIDKLDITFEPGFSVITGETGAGKSIILGAIGLLLGQRADIKAIRNGATKCIVEAKFRIASYGMEEFFKANDIEYDSEECILRREVNINGKSRAFINDTPASLAQMKVLGEKLIDVHSQHQNLLINKEGFQLNILDILAQDIRELTDYQNEYNEYKKVCRELDECIRQAEETRKEEDYIRFQLQQLDDAKLKDGEIAELEQEAETLTHAEDIKAGLYRSAQNIGGDESGCLTLIKDSINTLQTVCKVFAKANEWKERLESCYIEIKDISHDMEDAQESIEFNPSRLEFVNSRLNMIYSMMQKHHVKTDTELLEIAENYRQQLDMITSSDERISELESKKKEHYDNVIRKAEILTKMRTESAGKIQSQMESLLIPLGMPNVKFAVEICPKKDPDINGMDAVNFLFSANKNGTLQNVASIASGGEIARVMLSLKAMIAGAVKLPTIIFDEIDTGVSGSIAEKMALIMQDMGRQDRQVLSITHLPQIAARGNAHYKVYKEDTETGTNSHIIRLSDEERINEIANMLSGSTMTEAARNNARSLLGL